MYSTLNFAYFQDEKYLGPLGTKQPLKFAIL